MFNLLKKSPIEDYQERASERINFEACVGSYILQAWLDGTIDDRKLNSYDRYLLEFKHLNRGGKSIFGLWCNIVIYDGNLAVVYNAQRSILKALNSSKVNSKEQMLLVLEYWLSLDWESGND